MGFRFMNAEDKDKRYQPGIRSVYDFTMGVLWTAVGLFLLFYEKLGFTPDFDRTLAAIFGGTCLLYGSFRFYRGYKSRQSR